MKKLVVAGIASLAAFLMVVAQAPGWTSQALAQTQDQEAAATTEEAAAPEPLSDDEMEILVARIALYPDELVAAIVAASLYPVQIVQAQRYLEKVKTKPDLKPDKEWDGSVISLLNYPEVVTMMSDDLDWTEALGEVATNQQKDMLEAVQQLRDKAVAQGVLESNDKTVVTQESGKVVIQPASANEIYIPVYEPEMLYEPDYVPVPVTYYPEPYPSYYYPTAPYFAGFVTGAVWGAAIDWNDWGVWGGNGHWGNDVEINCKNCFNNINGKVKWNDVDWNKVDRNKISIDKNQFNKIDKNDIRRNLESNNRNNLKNKQGELRRDNPSFGGQQGNRQTKDVRQSTMEGLQKQDRQAKGGQQNAKKPAQSAGNKAPQRDAGGKADRPAAKSKPAGKPKPAARTDARPKNPSPMGEITRGQTAKQQSQRGAKSMGGGMNQGGGGQAKVKRRPSGGHGGGGGGRGGGGRGGGGRR